MRVLVPHRCRSDRGRRPGGSSHLGRTLGPQTRSLHTEASPVKTEPSRAERCRGGGTLGCPPTGTHGAALSGHVDEVAAGGQAAHLGAGGHAVGAHAGHAGGGVCEPAAALKMLLSPVHTAWEGGREQQVTRWGEANIMFRGCCFFLEPATDKTVKTSVKKQPLVNLSSHPSIQHEGAIIVPITANNTAVPKSSMIRC